MSTLRIVSVSGGKDSTALYCWAIDQFGKDGFRAVFSNTHHEHPVTLNYVRNLHEIAGGPQVEWVEANFSEKLKAKGVDPSENAFLDMMLWKGRAPSARAQFCTEHLKLRPIKEWLDRIRGDSEVISYTGIRAGESARRAKLPEREWSDLLDCYTERPLLRWSEKQVFEFLKEKGVKPNPMYESGFGRVGCFPCIHASKTELAQLPEWAWEKLTNWEAQLGRSWFPAGKIPLSGKKQIELQNLRAEFEKCYEEIPHVHQPACVLEEGDDQCDIETDRVVRQDAQEKFAKLNEQITKIIVPTIPEVREWASTSRGGSQFDMYPIDAKDVPTCLSTWSACE